MDDTLTLLKPVEWVPNACLHFPLLIGVQVDGAHVENVVYLVEGFMTILG